MTGIELAFSDYKTDIIPLYYTSMIAPAGFAPTFSPSQGGVLLIERRNCMTLAGFEPASEP